MTAKTTKTITRLARPARMVPFVLLVTAAISISIVSCARRDASWRIESAAESPWRFSRGPASATGFIPAAEFSGKLDVIWERKLSEKPQGPLSLSHNTLFYTGAKKRLFAVDPESGSTLSKLKARGCQQSGGLLVDSLLYHSTAPPFNQLDCRRAVTGELLWRSHILDISAPLSVREGRLLAVGGDGILYCFNRFDGELIWEFDLESKALGGVALQERAEEGALCWIGASSGAVFALDIDSGSVVFELSVDGPIVSALAVGGDGTVYLSAERGRAYALRVSEVTGEITSADYELASRSWSAPATDGAYVVFSDNSGGLFCFNDPSLTKPLWQVSLHGALVASPIIVGGFLIVGMLTGDLYCLDLSSGELISSRKLDYAIRQAPISDGSSIFVATQKRRLYRLGELETAERLSTR